MRSAALLSQNRIFMDVAPKDIAAARAFFARLDRFDPYQRILREGDADSDLYLIEAGTVIVKIGGKELGTLEAGEIMGEVGFVASGRRTANAFAGPEGALLRVVSPQDLRAFAEQRPVAAFTMAMNLAALIAGKLQRSNQSLRTLIDEARERGAEPEAGSQSVWQRLSSMFGA